MGLQQSWHGARKVLVLQFSQYIRYSIKILSTREVNIKGYGIQKYVAFEKTDITSFFLYEPKYIENAHANQAHFIQFSSIQFIYSMLVHNKCWTKALYKKSHFSHTYIKNNPSLQTLH